MTSEEMNKLDSYKSTMEADLKFYMEGSRVIGKIKGTLIGIFDDDDYKAMMEAIGGGLKTTYDSTKQTITFTIEDGKLTKIDSDIVSKGSVKSGMTTYGVTITISSIVVFNETTDNTGSTL